MKLNELNRWKEFWCVLNGHEFNERDTESDSGYVLEECHTCGNCGLTVRDQSGIMAIARQKFGETNHAEG